ncbi:hypothetical protein [Methylobacterium sp. NEAU K]|uniref:hypothetical protein n=1 Tax=Methylobacterium sp. NEAU K TaxID=3064946 RepID=UPI002733441F|nr:hypothetical protein [Methylobacterium sp. NEAU K]MDP4005291.1 hypothetical protein [Methylobacterium sp. NEAU K]
MIAALFALAAAMAIGGCAAVIQGFPYVRLESGLAMVIAGSVAASSGAVLFGIGVLALVFRRVERAIETVPAFGASGSVPAEGRSRLPSALPAAPAFIVPPVVEPPFDPERPRIEPGPDRREATPVEAPKAADARKPALAEADLPIPPPTAAPEPPPRPTPEVAPAAGPAPEDDLFAAPETPPETKEEAPSLRPSLDAAPEPESAPNPVARTVVGRYASGGNTYVMFEDGSIEADTPQGRFTFESLDELKAFVDGGGEAGNRGAA